MSSCRGILIAGVTNRARTQMAEGLLRRFTNNAVFICSGGWQHSSGVHPLAMQAMADVNIRIDGQTSTSLEGARRQRSTYDVYIGIDEPYTHRSSDHYQQRYEFEQEQQQGQLIKSGAQLTASSSLSLNAYSDPLLAAAMPSHWQVAQDTTDSRQSWTLWSPRDPRIFHETSTRKLQDHLYEGEPLFMRVQPSELRRGCRVRRRWEVPAVAERYAVESEAAQLVRFVNARTQLASLCEQLILVLEKEYGESLLDAAAVAAYKAAAAKKDVASEGSAERFTGAEMK